MTRPAMPQAGVQSLQELMALTGGVGGDLAAFNLSTSTASIRVGIGTMNADFRRDYDNVAHIDPFMNRARARGLFYARPGWLG